MIFLLFIAMLLGGAVFFLFVAGSLLGDLIKESRMTEDEKKAAMREDYLYMYGVIGWPTMTDITNVYDDKTIEDLKFCGLYDKVLNTAKAIELEDNFAREEADIKLEERRISLELRRQLVQNLKAQKE